MKQNPSLHNNSHKTRQTNLNLQKQRYPRPIKLYNFNTIYIFVGILETCHQISRPSALNPAGGRPLR